MSVLVFDPSFKKTCSMHCLLHVRRYMHIYIHVSPPFYFNTVIITCPRSSLIAVAMLQYVNLLWEWKICFAGNNLVWISLPVCVYSSDNAHKKEYVEPRICCFLYGVLREIIFVWISLPVCVYSSDNAHKKEHVEPRICCFLYGEATWPMAQVLKMKGLVQKFLMQCSIILW